MELLSFLLFQLVYTYILIIIFFQSIFYVLKKTYNISSYLLHITYRFSSAVIDQRKYNNEKRLFVMRLDELQLTKSLLYLLFHRNQLLPRNGCFIVTF
jgi:hypothetical protein